MGLKRGIGLEKWEIAVTKKLVDEFRRRSRILAREEFDDLLVANGITPKKHGGR